VQSRSDATRRILLRATKRTLAVCLLAALVPAQEVRSPNGKFLARIHAPGGVEVVDASGVTSGVLWSARTLDLPPKAEWRLTDDGHALAAIDVARALVQVVRDGKLLVLADAAALAIPQGILRDWLPTDVPSIRVRAVEREGRSAYRLDLLARDGGVRSIDLETGAIRLPRESPRPGPLAVDPGDPVAHADVDRFEPLAIGEWFAPEAIFEGEPLPVHVRGSLPTPAWKFGGFQILPRKGANDPVVLLPGALVPPPDLRSLMVLKGFEATASVSGLARGLHRIDVRGRPDAAPAADTSRAVRVLPLGTLVFFEAGELAVAWLDDGRVAASGKTRLASDEEQAALARAVAALPILSAKPGAAARATREFAWIVDGHPVRVVRAADELEPELARLEEVLRKLVPAADARDAYRVDPDHSFIEVKTGSGGLLSAFGHDHRLMVGKLAGQLAVDARDFTKSSVSITVQSASLAVVDDDSAKDRAEIEKEMNDHVLETARFPAIEFTSRSVEIRSRTKDVLEAVVEGDLALHGVVRRIRVPCRIELRDRALRTTGELKLKQTDFGISPTSAVAGTVKVDDVVRISFDVFATS